MAKKRVRRQTVSKNQLLKVDGMDDVLEEIEKRMDRMTGEAIKEALVNAAKPLFGQVKENIAGLSIGPKLKEMLTAQVAIMRGSKKVPRIMIGMSQDAGLHRRPDLFVRPDGKRKPVSPYWFEFGTAARVTDKGHATGAIKSTPFWRPALSSSKDSIRNRLAYELKKIVQDDPT
jgi:hypothetical protein